MSDTPNIGKLKLSIEEFLILSGLLALSGENTMVENMKKYDSRASEVEINLEKSTIEKITPLYSKHTIQKGLILSGAKKIAMKKELFDAYDDYHKKCEDIIAKYKD